MTFLDFHRNFPIEAACLYIATGFILATVLIGIMGLYFTNGIGNYLNKQQ